MKKILNPLMLTALLIPMLGVSTYAQKTRKSTTYVAPAASSESAPMHSSHHKVVEIASNQVLTGGLAGGGIISDMSISTQSGASVLFGLAIEGDFNIAGDWQISVPILLFASSSTIFELAVGPQYNFGAGGRMDQFFVNLRPGLLTGGGTEFILNGTIGKRFEIIPNVAYRPNFGITWRTDAGYVSFDLSPLAISIDI